MREKMKYDTNIKIFHLVSTTSVYISSSISIMTSFKLPIPRLTYISATPIAGIVLRLGNTHACHSPAKKYYGLYVDPLGGRRWQAGGRMCRFQPTKPYTHTATPTPKTNAHKHTHTHLYPTLSSLRVDNSSGKHTIKVSNGHTK